ncbi:DNA gyrase subunit A [archaeon]|nr:DNA gyrase subunit A [archaeon]|tara:strand:+ start:1493 stop:3895 length:2403 start_codon:yes stop_codon:yes gene_type:complete
MPEEIQNKLIEQEMKESYIDYSMSVIIGRALPRVEDGLKPVHRRILFAMHGMGLRYNKPFTKCARIVGDCFKYHPHGDTAIYDSLVRMGQDFSLRYPLIKGHGNFGSIEGFNPAHMRYTEAKLSKISEEMLVDIDKNTVDFVPNFDGSLTEPVVMPAKLPNLLVNGSSGIAVGMATNIPPHNLKETTDAVIATIENPEIEIEELMQHIKGPDFPTGAYILGKNGIKLAYKTGRGKVILRAKTEIKDNKIIITEIPYQVNKTSLIENIADLVREKRIEGISDIRDESDRKGMSIVIMTKRDSNPEIILNQLYKHSMLQTSFGIIMLALHNDQPKVMNLKQIITYFISHRKNVITRRTKFELKKAEDKLHILEGLRIALSNIDAIIKLIKASKDGLIAKQKLMENYNLSEKQSQAILDMRLQRLTSLEQNKIKEEYENLLKLIKELKEILASEERILAIIKDELIALKQDFEDERRTNILDIEEEIDTEDLIPKESVVVTVTKEGYIKSIPLTTYKQQRRGGKGIIAAGTKEDDFVNNIFITSTHSYLLFFSNRGKVYWLKAYKVPIVSRYSRGKAIVNLLKLEENERITTVLPVQEFSDNLNLFFATKLGSIKKTSLKRFSNPRKGGIKAINLKDKDELIQVRLTPGTLKLILGSKNGLAVKFDEKDVREIGRSASGVRGIRLAEGDEVVGLEVSRNDACLFTITENGFGKRTEMDKYRLIKRGGKGVRNIKTSERNGKVVGIKTVMADDEFVLISEKGVIIRVSAKDISLVGRNTQGVRVMKINGNDKVASIARINENSK